MKLGVRQTHLALFLAALCLGLGLIVYLVESGRAHDYLRRKLTEGIESATGSPTCLADFYFSPHRLELTLTGFLLQGSEPPPSPPLFAADRITVKFRILSLLKSKIDLKEIQLIAPTISILIDDKGRLKLPEKMLRHRGGRRLDLFDLAVKRFIMVDGRVNFNDKLHKLDFSSDNLNLHVGYDASGPGYRIFLAYRNGIVRAGSFSPLKHDLLLESLAMRNRLQVNNMMLRTPESIMFATAEVQGFKSPRISVNYHMGLNLHDLEVLLKRPAIPQGEVGIVGQLSYERGELTAQGNFASERVFLDYREFHAPVGNIKGQYALKDRTLHIKGLRCDFAGGLVKAEVSARPFDERPEFRAEFDARHIFLPQIKRAIAEDLYPLPTTELLAEVDSRGSASWHGFFRDIFVKAQAQINRSNVRKLGSSSAQIQLPISGQADFAFDLRSRTLTLYRARIKTDNTAVLAQGTLGGKLNLRFEGDTVSLPEAALLVLDVRRSSQHLRELVLANLPSSEYASFSGISQGSFGSPRIHGSLRAQNVRLAQGLRWDVVSLDVEYQRDELKLSNVRAYKGSERIKGEVQFGLDAGRLLPTSALKGSLSIIGADISELQRLANLRYRVGGSLWAHVRFKGTIGEMDADGALTITRASILGEKFDRIEALFSSSGGDIKLGRFLASENSSVISGSLRYDRRTGAYEFSAEGRQIDLGKIDQQQARRIGLNGTGSFKAKGRGTLREPRMEFEARFSALALKGLRFENVSARMDLDKNLLTFKGGGLAGRAPIDARGSLDLANGEHLDATIAFKGLALDDLFAGYLPRPFAAMRGTADGFARFKGPASDLTRIDADFDLANLRVQIFRQDVSVLALNNVGPIRIKLRWPKLLFEDFGLRGNGTELKLSGEVMPTDPKRIDVTARGLVSLELVRLFDPDLIARGNLKLDLKATGTLESPIVNGKLAISEGTLGHNAMPVILRSVAGQMTFDSDSVTVERLSGQASGGTVNVSGKASYGRGLEFQFSIKGNNVRYRYPEGISSVVDANLKLEGTRDAALLSGQVLIDRVSTSEDFDLAQFLRPRAQDASGIRKPPFARNLRLDLRLISSGELGLESQTVGVYGEADMKVRGTLEHPIVTGRLNISRGDVFFAGNRYRINQGHLELANPLKFEPVLSVSAETEINQYLINVRLSGPLNRLKIDYSSDPPLPPVDVINLIAFGTIPRGRLPIQHTVQASSVPQLGATSLLARALSNQVSSRVERLFGITHIQVDPMLTPYERNPTARFAIRKQVNRNLSVTYATNVTSTQQQIIQVEYNLSNRFAITAVRDESGTFSIDFKFRKRF